MAELHEADAILFAAHSQGSIVSTHLLDLLVKNKDVRTSGNTAPGAKLQRICLLAMCGIHQGLFRYITNDRFVVKPYFKVSIYHVQAMMTDVDLVSTLRQREADSYLNLRYK